MKDNVVVDSHSHIGKDIFHGDSFIDDYIKFAKESGIDVGILMGVPSPCIDLNNVNSRLMYWKYIGEKMQYYGQRNPFMQLNYDLNSLITQKSSRELILLFAAVFHPVMDDIDYFTKMLDETDPVAIKIHGIGSGVGPEDIGKDYIELLRKINIPIIVHTDCDFGKGSISMQHVRNINRAINWANFFDKNRIKGILNHGASLDKETFNIANNSEYLTIALGPDKIACLDENRLFVDCLKDYRNYLQYIKDNLKISKIIYDTDYNWNLSDKNDIDYDSVKRVKEIFGEEYAIKILGENLTNFNPKILKKVKEVR